MDNKLDEFKEGKIYEYRKLPTDSEDLIVEDFGEECLGQNAIHLRDINTDTDAWFIYESHTTCANMLCVYNR